MENCVSAAVGGVYVHIPFCRRKCLYCSFYSGMRGFGEAEKYVDALLNEFDSRESELPDVVSTLYIGGGTPSMLKPGLLEKLADGIRKIAGNRLKLREFTIEVNPEDVTEENADLWHGIGINRVSMGVQTLENIELCAIGRRHTAEEAKKAYLILRERFDNISLDLMFGLPSQTIDSFERTLDGMIEMNPDHLSVYSLMYEERSALTKLRDAGKIEESSEDITVPMYEILCRKLAEAGYEHYEISNFAKHGKRSVHNSSYWNGAPYLGIGPSAHSYDGKSTRRANKSDVVQYMGSYAKKMEKSVEHIIGNVGFEDFYEIEKLNDEELREEYILTRLRRKEGISLSDYGARFGNREKNRLERRAKQFIERGEMDTENDNIFLTEKGMIVEDSIILELAE